MTIIEASTGTGTGTAPKLSISEVAAETGLSTSTLHYYEITAYERFSIR